jgi:hypothetical protein
MGSGLTALFLGFQPVLTAIWLSSQGASAENKVSRYQWMGLILGFCGLLLVVWQLRDGQRQRESSSLVEIYDINRELLTLGFSHPQLFDVLDGKSADPVWERRYLQLWLNQLSLIHTYLQRSVFEPELEEWLEREVADFMTLPNVQRHWQQHRPFYPASFQRMVDDMLNPPNTADERPQAAKTCRAIFSNVARDMRTKLSPSGAVSTAPSAGAGMKPCTNTSPLSARMAEGHALLPHSWGITPCSPIIFVIFMVVRIRDFLREPVFRILAQERKWGRACLIGMEAAST